MGNTLLYDTVMCIDPGSNTLGVSLIKIAKDHPIVVSYAHTHRAEAIIRADKYQDLVTRYGELTARLKAHKDNLIRLIKILRPDFLVIESPFFNPRNPSSSEVLMRVKQMLIDVSIDEQIGLDIHWITPQQMKSLIGAKLMAGGNKEVKNPVKEAILNLYETNKIKTDESVDILSLDEHSLDSIGVGYAYHQLIEKGILNSL